MKIIAVCNQKGGVGKTTTATALVSGLKQKGFKTLLVDTDPQGNASDTFGAVLEDCPTVYTVFTGESDAGAAIQVTEQGDLIPGDLRMSAADMTFTKQGREFLLKKALASIADQYDYTIIDTPPALGIITINALTAAHSLIIPMLADRYSLQGIAQLADTIDTVREYSNAELAVEGILITRFNGRTILNRDVRDTITELAKNWDTTVFETTIRQSITISEAQTQQESIFHYAPASTIGLDYAAFVDEYERRSRTNG